jgi:hypothetical protein
MVARPDTYMSDVLRLRRREHLRRRAGALLHGGAGGGGAAFPGRGPAPGRALSLQGAPRGGPRSSATFRRCGTAAFT